MGYEGSFNGNYLRMKMYMFLTMQLQNLFKVKELKTSFTRLRSILKLWNR